ncbi:hypothetical protein C882_2364 [Caenispirillum salinarum AK4]|uniref:DUF421 domain-containing protein n=1 Tax=Caenispirillum salinarum AK4 TaxID=1238182 RepID=K9H3Z5_9PROT|nr:YetF domain-containing protein [Caenispirillum salinarum]EKV32287.1 hypothetical protein C882_2364 [Caenispirillum salinarum AK4]
MFFDQWEGILRVLVVGTLAYAALVVLLRLTGKRTLSKMNAFDFVVTVALGSTLATVLLSESVALAEGVAAFALLIGLQMVVAWGSARSRRFRHLVKAEPRLLLHRGAMLDQALLDERVAPEEVLAAIRASGQAEVADVTAVILETDGSFSVVAAPQESGRSALSNVRRE